jgi:tetratricopeptide (TPR) repeat protein
MNNKKYSIAGKFNGAAHKEKTSNYLKDTVPGGRIRNPMVQNVLLIWLDQNIDDKKPDCQNTVAQLRRIVNSIHKYTNSEECSKFLETIDNEKVCMIISGSLGQGIVPRLHDMLQVDSIFIFCSNKHYHQQWTKQWSKIKGVFTNITSICDALKKAARQCEQDSMPISFIDTTGDVTKKNLDQLEPTFMYTQILKEILLTIEFEQTHFMEFIAYCRDVLAENEKELTNVKKFQQGYRDETPIWWYTCDCFLHSMLNRALWEMNAEMIIKLGFFVNDLHRQIGRLHREQFGGHRSSLDFTVYRGQGMLKTEFEKLSKMKNGLISFNNFLSTSKKRDVSLKFVNGALTNSKMVGILFVIKLDPNKSTTPFASITKVSYFKEIEDEVLFSMHTVFRIGEIRPMSESNRLFEVKLTLTCDNDKELSKLTDRIREETYPDNDGWFRLGRVLLKMGQSEEAEQVCEILLEQANNEREKARIYHILGTTKYNLGKYKQALQLYKKVLEIHKRTLSSTDLNLANCYNNIGLAYDKLGDYPKALWCHEKALEIKQQSLPSNHPDVGCSYNNIGLVYYTIGNYVKALSSHKKALEIKRESLPSSHPDLGISYNNIGLVYYNMRNYPKALWYYEKALEIRQRSLPPNHPDLGCSYNNIGLVYYNIGNYPRALSSHKKALEIKQQLLPSHHPDLRASYYNIGLVYYKMGEYSKAHSCYERAMNVRK